MNAKLTASRLSCLRACPRRHYYRYELGLARVRQDAPLRFGAAFHRGLEHRNRGKEAPVAMAEALAGYDLVPEWADPTEWAVERETLAQLLAGYFWRYENDCIEFLAVEQTFELPLTNPDTGKSSRTFVLAGKIDAIAKLPDGRIAVVEYKTAGEDIGPEAEYWLRLRCDPQISHYVIAARALGFDVSTVLYDVTRKPMIQPLQVPLLDDNGLKIVLDSAGNRVMTKDGRKPRETGSTADGYVLQTRPETPEQFGRRLLDDIAQRPDFYLARREVPRLEDDLAEYQAEVWQQAQQLLEIRRRADRLGDPACSWFRSVGRWTCGYCDFSSLCFNSVRVAPGCQTPAGFQILSDPHPELAEGATA